MTALSKSTNTPDVSVPRKGKNLQIYNFLVPLIFLVLFIICIYSVLFMALFECANWIISTWQISFFMQFGAWGGVILALALPLLWAVIVVLCAYGTYAFLRAKGRFILAQKTATVIIFAMFHIFAFPWILWPMLRRASPKLQKNYRKKLKKMVLDGKMQPRLDERRRLLLEKGYKFN